ncbi:hypothetical protein ABMA32_07840 [Mesorhizobium sp. VNQ89]|uniref:hypothetical protein n=1 Tax=Mesorhizobium quangtriensis TaxID=3157709 RepID=UPI0032B769D6
MSFLDRFRQNRFEHALRRHGLQRCSMSGSALCIGMRPHTEYNRIALDTVPEAPSWVCFLEAPEQAHLIRAFVSGPQTRTVERLIIGTSQDYDAKRSGYDMTDAIAALKGARLPALKRLVLGEMELLFNGHALYGSLGDITHIFEAAPQLEELELCGRFSLKGPVRHEWLRTLSVSVFSDIGIGDGPLSQDTVSHLLLSHFPRLTACSLHLDETPPDVGFSVPEEFFARPRFLAMQSFSINALTPESEARMKEWMERRRVG